MSSDSLSFSSVIVDFLPAPVTYTEHVCICSLMGTFPALWEMWQLMEQDRKLNRDCYESDEIKTITCEKLRCLSSETDLLTSSMAVTNPKNRSSQRHKMSIVYHHLHKDQETGNQYKASSVKQVAARRSRIRACGWLRILQAAYTHVSKI